jgi:2-polyprenyl-3-methyl-5-hydroxy-6-metoxy-1,4-benzoquinol methylase
MAMTSRNTPQLWDKLWERETSKDEDLATLRIEERTVRWRKLKEIVLKKFHSFDDLKVIEIGAGTGTYSGLMAKQGAKATMLDSSENALSRGLDFMVHNNLKAEFMKCDALSLSDEIRHAFDISMSFGMAEHFRGDERIKAIKAHFDVLKNGGITFISVPNKYNPPYRFYKFVSELTNRWTVGEEYPFSRREMRNIVKGMNPKEYFFFGDSFISSFNFFLRTPFIRKYLTIRQSEKAETKCLLDQYFSYSIVLYAMR